VAASLGPYGAALADGSEYTGYQNVSIEQLMDFHKERLALIQQTEADIIAFETIPCIDEAIAIKNLLADQPNKKHGLVSVVKTKYIYAVVNYLKTPLKY